MSLGTSFRFLDYIDMFENELRSVNTMPPMSEDKSFRFGDYTFTYLKTFVGHVIIVSLMSEAKIFMFPDYIATCLKTNFRSRDYSNLMFLTI